MLASIVSSCVHGLDGFLVSVEVDITAGMPSFSLVGLPDQEVKEAKDRVLAAIRNSGYEVPLKKITVNLAPAELKKAGAHFDLPIALGILAASGQISKEAYSKAGGIVFIGSLGLNGRIHACGGVLPMLISLKKLGRAKAVIPFDNGAEASYAGISAFGVKNLKQTVDMLEGKKVSLKTELDYEVVLKESTK